LFKQTEPLLNSIVEMRKLKLSQLQMLVAVVNSGGFGRAAAELGCTQSRISHAISELEEILGTRMLLRSRTGCAPTDTGHRVVAQARQMLNLADILVEGAKDDLSVVGRVRIACFRSIGTHLLPRVLEALAVEFPGIRVDVDDNCEERDEVTLAVEERRADIGIAQLPISPGLVSRPYISDSYVVVAPSSLPLREPFSWEQIIDVPYIQLKCSGAHAVLSPPEN
jgi:DNA-binding transcriptional LysR family regulator